MGSCSGGRLPGLYAVYWGMRGNFSVEGSLSANATVFRLDLPAVVLALRNTKLYLPMEVLTVVSGQRVPLYKQTARQTKETIKVIFVFVAYLKLINGVVMPLNCHKSRHIYHFWVSFVSVQGSFVRRKKPMAICG